MDFRELQYFVTIAETESLTRSAEMLYISQSTLSKYILRLEKEFGVPLFQHLGKRVVLTYAGKTYLEYARRLLGTKHELDNAMTDIVKENSGYLRVGMPPFRCSIAMPAVLPAFHQMYPNVTFQFLEDNSENLDKALREGQLDLCFYNLSEERTDLCYELIEKEQLYAILPLGHPIRERALPAKDSAPRISLEWLADETFIIQNRYQRLGQYILHVLQEKHIRPKKILESTNIRTAASLASSGYGVSFISGGLMRHLDPNCHFDYYSLYDCDYPISYVAAWRQGAYLPHYAREFIRLMHETNR